MDFHQDGIRRNEDAVPPEKAEGAALSEGDAATAVGAQKDAEGGTIRLVVHQLPAPLGIDQHAVYFKISAAAEKL